jgi:hypothetical protein
MKRKPEDLLSMTDVMRILRKTRQTIRNYVRAGLLTALINGDGLKGFLAEDVARLKANPPKTGRKGEYL